MHSTAFRLPPVRFLTSGHVTDAAKASAERALREALSGVRGEVTSVALTVSVVADDALPRPALVQAVVEVEGRKVRAQAAAPTLAEAIDVLRGRLAVKVSSLRPTG